MMELIKLGIAAVVGLALLFGLVMPLVRGLLLKRAPAQASAVMLPPGAAPPALPPGVHGGLADDQVKLSTMAALPQLSSPPEYETPLQAAKVLVEQDPARAVQVLRSWLSSDG